MQYKIPVVRPSMPPFEEFIEEIRDLWTSRYLTNYGEKYTQFVIALSEFLKINNLVLFTNGHQALEAIFHKFPRGSEVITTPYTYASTTQAIVRSGLIPVFCDIEPEFYTIDPQKIQSLITDKTVAIAAVHTYGNVCRHEELKNISEKYNLELIYDAAHAFGVTYNGISIGNLGDDVMFSFHATKVFHTFEGGGLSCSDAKFLDEAKAWSKFGMIGNEDAEYIGTNAKMTEIQAAMGLCNLRHFNGELALRKIAATHYKERLSNISGLYFCAYQPNTTPNYSYMPVRFGKNRDQIANKLESKGIATRKYFYPLTSTFSAYHGLFPLQKTPIAEQISKEILCLPLYAGLTCEEIDIICDTIINEQKIFI